MKRIRWEDRGDGYWFAKVADGITAWIIQPTRNARYSLLVWVGVLRCASAGTYKTLRYAKRTCREWITAWLKLDEEVTGND